MKRETTRRSLSPARKRFLRLLQAVNFGKIESLVVRNGEPLLTPKPRILRSIRFGGRVGSRPEVRLEDFALKRQVTELFQHFDRLQNGRIASLDVKDGLPCHMVVEEHGTEEGLTTGAD
jgi:hypothetical protein